MYYLDSEKSIISSFQSVNNASVYFPIENAKVINVFESIHNQDNWKLWTESAGKSDPPPDFYSDKYKCMMEVMRVDDHSYKNKKGKVVNPTNIHIRDVEKEIVQSGIMDMFPNAELMINAFTDLPTNQDHNYTFYYKSFIRTVKHHIEKIPLYKKNHPNYDMVFFVMDESSAYFEANDSCDAEREKKIGKMISGYPHFHFMDRKFVSVFEETKVDYLVWYTPFKFIKTSIGKLDLPEVCVLDIKRHTLQYKDYNDKYMISAEI
ncbi:MAG: hypothetical protein NC318_11670 [Blautia sp.]|nr:hypothetical protein [Blautia sp.]